jgi:hypothetical protein
MDSAGFVARKEAVMDHDRCHNLPRALATGGSRRHALMRLAALLAIGLLTTFGITLAQVVEVDPLTTSGLTVSELEELMRDPPNQAICAQMEPNDKWSPTTTSVFSGSVPLSAPKA